MAIRFLVVSIMKPTVTLLSAFALLMTAAWAGAAAAKPHGSLGIAPPSTGSVAPLQAPPPQVNPGALGAPAQFGTPSVNTGTIGSIGSPGIGNAPSFGALPGNPGSATYDPNAALPPLGNQGSALSPTPGTSGAGFNTPSTSSGTNSGG
jgi:hypothetical protein